MAETISIMDNDKRLEHISEQIVRFTNADFTSELKLSDKRDEIDSIIVGLNLLGEELKSYIDQTHQREVQLKEALYRFNEAQHLTLIGSWEWDIPQNRIEWTDELYRLYGLERGAFDTSYENYLKLIHPEDSDFVNERVQKAYKDRKPFDFFHRIIHTDGTIRIVHSKGVVYTDNNGQPTKMSGTAQDVTIAKETEDKNHRLAAIVESSSDAIISKTLAGIITSWNIRAEEMFGYKKDEVIGKHISILFPKGKLSEEEVIMEDIRSGKPLINYETERKRKDGTEFSVAITISPIFDSQRKVIGVSKIARDVTDKKIVEERLRRYIQELEYKNNEAQQFSYVASHDLQEPLRTITNYINLFSNDYKGKLDSDADLYIKLISGGASRMRLLIRDLMEYTRIENNNTLEDIDCNILLKEIIGNLEAAIHTSKAVIKIDPLPVIEGFKIRINSLFQNLISNAIKFRKKDVEPIIHISAENKGDAWLFVVKDNGIGIEKDYYDKIFKLFQRLHLRDEYEGTGIGLAHCKKIVELRGGKIWVESTFGVGSSFYISLPKKFIL